MDSADLSSRPTYTPTQLDRYFNHIAFDRPRISPDDAKSAKGLEYLTALQKRHMFKVPFENLSLHYSKHRFLSIDPEDLYAKVVERGHGGYCMENNCFFETVLRSLGFQLYSAGARVSSAVSGGNQDQGFDGWSHMVNICTIGGQRYMVDVGFGASGPIAPLPLADGKVSAGIRPQSLRLSWTNIAPNTDPSQRLWLLQSQSDPESSWSNMYCFTETEFTPKDYTVMNHYTSTSKTSWFTQAIVCTATILEGEEVVGNLVLSKNEFKKKIHGEAKDHLTCETEAQRVEALETWFGITLTKGERQGIKGTVTEIKG
ncbi:MAG: N-terminal acetyltransferase [Piccolia ochrophora]|nr:MAG: N-terminal acetyltransferase [Piccolia ochrophora]